MFLISLKMFYIVFLIRTLLNRSDNKIKDKNLKKSEIFLFFHFTFIEIGVILCITNCLIYNTKKTALEIGRSITIKESEKKIENIFKQVKNLMSSGNQNCKRKPGLNRFEIWLLNRFLKPVLNENWEPVSKWFSVFKNRIETCFQFSKPVFFSVLTTG